ncbi:MAG: helix-turn-helix domain-containing protein [Burkholderiales bacterium]
MHEPTLGERPTDIAEEPPRTEHVGEILARARVAQGLTLEDVAQQLKFGTRQIGALEQGRFENLPGSTFARGMVRSYARLLKLDAEALLSRLQGKFEVPDADRLATRYREPVPFSDGSRRSTIAYAVLSVALMLVVAGVLYGWQQERSSTARLNFVPAARAPLEPPRAAAVTAPRRGAAAPASIVSPGASAGMAPPPAQAPVENAPGATPTATAPATGRIALHFDAESWVEIRDASGKVLLSQLNPAGSEKVVQGRAPFAVVVGNAQHVQLTYDGQAFDLVPHIRVEVARFTLK